MAGSSSSERFRAVRKALGISQRDFAAGIYLSHSFYAKIETGTRNPNERVYELISNKYKVSKDWLSTGRGEMFSENPPDAELIQITDILRELDPLFRDCIIQQIKLMANLHRKSKEGQTAPKGKTPPKTAP
ncbi:MAG: helix-turn-helix domain-containing protein [Spirochaetaceae bacterium]|jgi:transcriptional regulator with XRE-family HTH domain|nr:helix-turn-helix domain-containing protein [Spirochaetaceae bacterium]